MPAPAPSLPVFRTPLQADVLYAVFSRPRVTAAQVCHATGASQPTAYRELTALADAGVLTAERRGRAIEYFPDETHPATAHLRALTTLTRGPVEALRDALGPVPGVEQVVVYGAWAQRARGIPGAEPTRLDVLVVGGASEVEVYEAVEAVEVELGVDVTVKVATADAWHDGRAIDAAHSASLVVLGGARRPLAP